MSIRRVLLPWSMQPQGAVQIDPGSPLAQSMVADWLASVGAVMPGEYGFTGNMPQAPGVAGLRYGPMAYVSNDRLTLPNLGPLLGGNYTVAFVLRALSTADTGFGDLSTHADAEHLPYAGVMYLTGGAASRQAYTIPAWLDITKPFCLVITTAAGGSNSTQTAYANGRLISSTTATGTTNAWNPTANIGSQGAGNGWSANQEFYRFTAWNRALPPGEAEEFSARFWAGYTPQSIVVPVSDLAPASQGTTSATLAGLTSSAQGVLALSAQVAATLEAASLSSIGSLAAVGISGALSATLGGVSASASGAVRIAGSASASLSSLALSGVGSLRASAALASTLGAASLSASGVAALTGQASATLGTATLAASGVAAAVPSGVVSATLAAVTLSATSTKQDAKAGALTVTLGAVAASATGVITDGARGQVDAALAPATLAATATLAALAGGQVSSQLAPATLQASAALPASAAAAVLLGALASASTGTSPRRGDVAIALDSASLAASATLMAQGGGVVAAVLAPLLAQSSGQSTLSAQVGAALEPVTLAASGALQALPGGTVAQQLQALSANAQGALRLAGAASAALAPLQLTAAGESECAGDLASVLGDLSLLAAGRDPSIPQFLTVSQTRRVAYRIDRRVVRPNPPLNGDFQ